MKTIKGDSEAKWRKEGENLALFFSSSSTSSLLRLLKTTCCSLGLSRHCRRRRSGSPDPVCQAFRAASVAAEALKERIWFTATTTADDDDDDDGDGDGDDKI